MKIENYEVFKSDISADTFNFPYNPRVYNADVEKFVDEKQIPYSFTIFGTANSLISRRPIVINGHFSGATKNSDYRSLVNQIYDNKIKKLFFSDDLFYIVIPRNVKETRTGERINFVDYVASFTSPFGIAFSNTQKDGNSSSSEENEGNTDTPIEIISGGVTNGSPVTIKDKYGNGFTFTPSSTGTFTYRIIYNSDHSNDVRITEYADGYIGTTRQRLKVAESGKRIFITLKSGESLNDLFTGGEITGITPTFYFRDGYSGE